MALKINYVPGYIWTIGELMTEDKLNAANNPTISLEGTIGTTTVGDGAITAAKLAASVVASLGGLALDATLGLSVNVDGVTIQLNGTTGQLQVNVPGLPAASIDVSQLKANANPDFTGATTGKAGTRGWVPAPQQTDLNNFLSAQGGWASPFAPELGLVAFRALK